MALSLDSMFRPFNEFFLTKFGSGLGASVKFRFSRLPHTFVDSDFVVAEHPEWGPSKQLAQEIFSNVIDQIPTLDPDGRNVSSGFGAGLISELYSDEILGPAIPFVPAAVSNDADKQAMVDAFNGIKAEARSRWDKTKLASLMQGQQGKEYRPSTPTPVMWWDKNAPDVWTPQTFHVEDASPPPAQPGSGILRMKISDAQMETVLQRHPQTFRAELASATVRPSSGLNRPTMMMARSTMAGAPVAASPTANVAFHTNVIYQMSAIPVDQRREMQVELAQYQTTQPIVSSQVTISFDFCTVNCERDWLHNGLLNSTSWYIPGRGKGILSANNGHGVPAMPVGFVAVKNLRIQAPWTPADINNLELSVQFGPFNFDSKVVNGVISHDGIQIVGWMLKDSSDLPPNAGA
jgi:hypothetical protein